MDEVVKHNLLKMVQASSISIPIYLFLLGFLLDKKELLFVSLMFMMGNFLNQGIKQVILSTDLDNEYPIVGKMVRPPGETTCKLFDGYGKRSLIGMPSGHAQFAAMFCIFACCYIFYEQCDGDIEKAQTSYALFKFAVIIALSFVIASSRYFNGCHTIQQIIIGSILGGMLGYFTYRLSVNMKN